LNVLRLFRIPLSIIVDEVLIATRVHFSHVVIVAYLITWVTGSHVIVGKIDGTRTWIRCNESCLHDDGYLRHISNVTESVIVVGHRIGRLNRTTLFAGRLMTALTSLDLTGNYVTEVTNGGERVTYRCCLLDNDSLSLLELFDFPLFDDLVR